MKGQRREVPAALRVGPLVQLRGLGMRYREGDREHVVLRGIDATIGHGEFVALLGRSGSGKSTLLNLIGGIDRPATGEVIIAGTALGRLSERQRTLFRRRHIGFVFQFFNLIPTLSVEENVLLPIELRDGRRAADRQAARRLLSQVGLEDRTQSFPDRLSGGEQQRVAIARALAADPLLLLADEPTGNLDPDTGTRVMDMLDRLVRQGGRTMLLATHSRQLAARADRVLTIREQRLVESPRPST